jgi:hypothetical protein
MKRFGPPLILALVLATPQVFAWSNHSILTYRALEQMPELTNAATVAAEPLEAFLTAEETTIEVLLASQEAWAAANLEKYPTLPVALTFQANSGRTDEARRLAFLTALRVAPNSRFALYIQPDPQLPSPAGIRMAYAAVNTLPEAPNSGYKFIGLKPGDPVAPLAVIASAADEPDYGLDINLWEDSPSDWGKVYGFGPLPFGNPALNDATQAPFHMGFYHEDPLLYVAAPFIKRTFPLLRSYQYGSLAALAFRTGHAYWGWRFAGLSLHYLQDLTQPYHASLAPGSSTVKLLGINLLALAGLRRQKDELVVLLSNRHRALEKYQKELLQNAASSTQDTALEKALHTTDRDASYPPWSDRYLLDVVTPQSAAYAPQLAQTLVATLPERFVSDPAFDFGVKEAAINMVGELAKRDAPSRARLDSAIAELLGNFGAHTRNAVRGILKASDQP